MNYTQSQLEAIRTIEKNLQIIACAGSGKTQVISRRIVEILRTQKPSGIGPANIVAFTFTEKAAGELKDRIQRLCLEELGTDEGLSEMYVGTIHGYCLNLLQQPPSYKFLKYGVLTEIRQRLLIDRNSLKSGLTETPLLSGGNLSRWKDSRLYQTLLGVLDEGHVSERKVPREVLAASKKYHSLLHEKKYIDYSGMVRQAVEELVSNAKLRQKVQSTVRFLVVDEYQDVNPLQEELIRQIVDLGANICVVGDDDQTIYQWRGSDVTNIIDFAKRYKSVKAVRLNENYRSSRGVVLTARNVVERNPSRLDKKMESTEAQPFQKGDILALQFQNASQEADWIADKINWLVGIEHRDRKNSAPRGLTFSDIAVLVRAWKDAAPITRALKKADIPFLGGGMNSLFDTEEVEAIRDVFYYLARHQPKGSNAISRSALSSSLRAALPGLANADIASGLKFLDDIRERIPKGSDNQLFLQRVYLDLLERMSVREDRIGTKGRTGEVIFFNLGKFSQLVSDFEQINFHSSPSQLYEQFASFLEFQAPDYYPEETEETAHAQPNAVRILTVHQAKGMQWPAVFVPCLRKNRFPSKRQGGRAIWHVIPESSVKNADRYKGTVEDERRLFYVALTRSERFLFCSWGPIPDNQLQRNVSSFFGELTESEYVLGRDPRAKIRRLPPQPRTQDSPFPLTFSELKYFFECPYQFKLRFLYGFDSPVNRALGFGKSLHDALCEIHSESINGKIPSAKDVTRLVNEHLHLPFANTEVFENSAKSAKEVLSRYLNSQRDNLSRLEHAEKTVELKLADGIVVSGRIDLIRRTDTNETAIVDFKSEEDTQPKEMSLLQLNVYAAGYKKATGKNADLVEIHNLEAGHTHRELVQTQSINATLARIVEAGKNIRDQNLPPHKNWCTACSNCDMAGICRTKQST